MRCGLRLGGVLGPLAVRRALRLGWVWGSLPARSAYVGSSENLKDLKDKVLGPCLEMAWVDTDNFVS